MEAIDDIYTKFRDGQENGEKEGLCLHSFLACSRLKKVKVNSVSISKMERNKHCKEVMPEAGHGGLKSEKQKNSNLNVTYISDKGYQFN